MTRDQVRFQELVSRPHLWPEERAELRELAERLGVGLRWYRERLDMNGPRIGEADEPADGTDV